MLWMKGFAGRSTAATLALAALCVMALGVGSARAGKYHVYSCRMPDGSVAPTDGWSDSKVGVSGYVEDGCSESKALIAALGDGSTHAANTDIATWKFNTPGEDALIGATLWRAGDADGGLATNATYEFWLAGPDETKVFDECVYEFGCQLGMGDQARPLSSSNRIVVPANNLGATLYLNASCGGVSTYSCPSGKGDPNGYAAVVYLYAADLVLEQVSQPTVTKVEGELATAPTLSGTADLAFHAEDSGSGVYQAVFTVDGIEAGHTLLSENGGHCRDVGQTTDGLPAFLYLRPCSPSLSADLPFDTTTLTDGAHHLVVSVTNAAGNSTVALDRKITVLNPPSVPTPPRQNPAPSQPSPEGQGPTSTTKNDPSSSSNPAPQLQGANGTNASAGATLRVHWRTTAKASIAGVYGHAQTVLGRLTAPGGAPVSGALVQVLSTPSFQGAKTVALASVHTASNGSFRLRLPAGTPSSRLTFAYSSRLGQAVPDVTAALELTVPARLSLHVTPRTSHVGGSIVFTGTLLGAPLPPGGKQLVLEARTPGGPWRQFQVFSTAARGHYRAIYRFRLAGPITYEFRAVCPKEADFPYGNGASNVVSVHER
jgi:hypothetical protein